MGLKKIPVVEMSVGFVFECAHFSPSFPEGHPNKRVHGHTYYGTVVVENPIDERTGFVMDVSQFQEILKPIVQKLDHHFLNEIKGLELPSSEWIAVWVWEQLASRLTGLKQVEISRPSVGLVARYRGQVKDSL
jgi:6-pyruvoyltetrahydropterin/6-carboxytetrahydropterin synthase